MVLVTSETQFSKTGIEVTYTDSTSGETSKQKITFANKTLTLDSGLNVTAGNVNFGQNISTNGNLSVAGTTHLGSSLQVDGNLILGGTLSATGAITIDSSMDIKGSTHLESTLIVDQAATLHSTLDVTGATTLEGTLEVTGITALNSSLGVSGPTILENTLGVAGAATLHDTLSVVGDATFQNNMTVNGNLTVLGNLTSLNTTSLEIKDSAIILADGNTSDAISAGIQVQYKPTTSNSILYAGVKRRPQTGEFVFFTDSSTIIENTQSTADIYANVLANSFSCASDKRLKENIEEVDDALGKVQQMRGVYYTWIDKHQPQTRQLGVIAQEVQAVCPELVERGGNDYLSVDYPKLTAVLIQAVKELKTKVDAMERRKRVNRTRKHRGQQKTKRVTRI